MLLKNFTLTIFIINLLTVKAFAYLGPGMGTGIIATIIGIIAALLLLIVSIVYYPIKRLLNKKKKNRDEGNEQNKKN